MADILCKHCGKQVQGNAMVGNGAVFHPWCVQPHRDKSEGYLWDCPKCDRSGKVDDPGGRTEEVDVPLAPGETPLCAYDGCRGCRWCRTGTKRETRPVKVTCPLCKGRGKLKSEPKPVSRVVDWMLEGEDA